MLPNTTFNYVIYYSLHCIDVGIVGKINLKLEGKCDGMGQKLVSTFVVIKCSNEPSYHHILIPQCIHVGCFA